LSACALSVAPTLTASLVSDTASVSVGGVASANPFFAGRFDGLLGGPLDDRPFAIYWNPALLNKQGFAADLHLGLIARQGTYDRVLPEDTPPEIAEVNGGYATTNASGVLPSVALQYGARSGDVSYGFGAALYLARAGTSDWNRHPDAPSAYPGAYDGPQRWSALSTSMLLPNAALGFSIGMGAFSAGVSVNGVRASLSTTKAANPIDKTDDLINPDGDIKEGRIFLDNAVGYNVHVGAGVALTLPDLQIGVSWRQPVTYQLEGTANVLTGSEETTARAGIELQVAGSLMASIGYHLTKEVRLRFEYEYQNWSIMDTQRIVNLADQAELLLLERFFKDTNAYRVRLDHAISDALTLHGGLTFEEGATPEAYHEAGLAEHDQVEGGVGLTYALSKTFEIHTSFMWQHFLDRTVRNSAQKPSTNGDYTDNRQYLATNLLWRWGTDERSVPTKAPSQGGDQL
jgi:hypothetical protein